MKGLNQQLVLERAEEGNKDKKSRRNRRSRKRNPSSTGVGHIAVDGVLRETPTCLRNGNALSCIPNSTSYLPSQMLLYNFHGSNDTELSRASDVAFSSLPSMSANDNGEFRNVLDRFKLPSCEQGEVFSKSGSGQVVNQEMNEFRSKDFLSPHKNGNPNGKNISFFVPHMSAEDVKEGIERGEIFRTSFRVNAHNPAEGYCTIDGVPTDILINGVHAQNRAVEGDTVGIKVDPLACWTRLRGWTGHTVGSSVSDDCSMSHGVVEVVADNCKGKGKLDLAYEDASKRKDLLTAEQGFHKDDRNCTGILHPQLGIVYGNYTPLSDILRVADVADSKENSSAIEKICAMVNSCPSKRPTGRVVAILERSPRRDSVVGFLGVKQWISDKDQSHTKRNSSSISSFGREHLLLTSNDSKLPKMLVPVKSLPDSIKMRLEKRDATVEMELVAAQIVSWNEASTLPQANIVRLLGRGGEIGSQISAILYENAICSSEFSPESLTCLPSHPWEVPKEEVERRKDLRNLCTFTIDPSTATDLDDAVSVERVSDDILRVWVHISDVSYFVLPGSALDIEAQKRSTSFYLRKLKLSMLPPLLSEDMGSLIPGVDRLAFSIKWDINVTGDVVDRWLGRTVIHSCCKLSYQHAQDIVDGLVDSSSTGSAYPELCSEVEWLHITRSIKSLHEISKRLKEKRFKEGALCLDSPSLVFSFDECGIPLDCSRIEQKDSQSLVEELMLLANRTVAEVISRAFPDSALLRRHPEPNTRKLRELELFCQKRGLELDTSSSGSLQLSLGKIKETLKNDPVFFDILLSYASKPMQLAAYFCTGDFKDRSDWTHYSLAVPHYSHFTSPLRRYSDIVVHRTLAAAIEAECMYVKHHMTNRVAITRNCFTGIYFDEDIVGTKKIREALLVTGSKHQVPCSEVLTEVASYCNKRKMASKHAEDDCDKLYLWALLKKKQSLLTEARVLSLGPKFMSIYVHKFAIERRIYYDEVDGLATEWLEKTSTLVLNLCKYKHSHRRANHFKCRPLEDVACIISPYDLNQDEVTSPIVTEENNPIKQKNPNVSDRSKVDPNFLPLTLRILSTISVALHAIGGDDGPLDIGARLYLSSYLQ